MPTRYSELRILCFKEETQDQMEWWVAQCLEYDIAAQGRTINDALYEFQRLVVGRVSMAAKRGVDDPFQGLKRAPEAYWQRFEKESARIVGDTQTFRFPDDDEPPPAVPPFEARVA